MEETTTHPRRARRRRRRSLLPLAILLAALAIAVPVILSLLPRQPRVEPEPEDPHAGQVYVNDGANMVWLTPHKNLAVNIGKIALRVLGQQKHSQAGRNRHKPLDAAHSGRRFHLHR